jgi:hypothetical protein
MTVTPATVAIAIAVPLVAWRIYSRFRRMVGRQRLSKVRPWITLTLFPLLVLLLASASLAHPVVLAWLAAGLAVGAALARYGLRSTRFEAISGEGFFYTPNAPLGIALTVLFIGRILYRVVEMRAIAPGAGAPPDFARSPVTLAVFGLLAGYYIAYAIGLVRWRAGVMRAKRERETAASAGPGDAPPSAR